MKSNVLFTVVLSLLTGISAWGAPVISSFSPGFGSYVDGNITIKGSGFGNPVIVRFNGVTATTAGATTATTILARVPTNAPLGSNPIFVSVGGQGTFSAEDFLVIGPGPYITNFTPGIGGAGASIDVLGTHFTGATAVRFNGRAASAFIATDSRIEATVPANATSGPISVERTGVGTNTTTAIFYVPAVISGFTPTAGRVGTNVLITGTNFLGTTSVRFTNAEASFLVLSNNALLATIPTNAVTGQIRVITPAGSSFSTSNYVVQPIIFGFTPNVGRPGTNVIIAGAHFTPDAVIRFNGVQAAAPTSLTATQLTAVVPAAATTGPISITTSNGSHTNVLNFFLPPVVTGFSTNRAVPGTLVTVTGTNFLGATNVTFNGTAATEFFVTNNNVLGVVVPADVISGPITVAAPAGIASSTNNFFGTPAITSFNPTHGLPGTNVSIIGVNFLGATVVQFGGTNATTFTVVNNTNLTATVPANAQTGPITVVTPGGTAVSAQDFVLDYTANLVVAISDTPDPVVVGSNVTYTITVANNSGNSAPGVTLTATLTGPGSLKSATTTQGTLVTNTFPITGDIGTLTAGNSAIITLVVTAQDVGRITNAVTVASLYPDPVPANNSITAVTTVQPLPLLSIRLLDATRLRITWPAGLTNYTLQFRPSFDVTNFWSNVVTTPNLVGAEYQLTETNTEAMRFYRLRRLQ